MGLARTAPPKQKHPCLLLVDSNNRREPLPNGDAMYQMTNDFVEANGIKLHYFRTGRVDRPTVILLHGVTDSGKCWSSVAAELADVYDVVMPDARGHGRSDAPELGYGEEDRAADVAGLIRALRLDRPVLLGHSMGAATAISTAALFPDLVRAVILEDPPWPGRSYGSTAEEREARAQQWREDIDRMQRKSIGELIAEQRQQYPHWSDDELNPWAEAKQQVSANIASMMLAPRRRWSDYLRQAGCPLLLIVGDVERGAIVSPATINEAKMFWQNGRAYHIPDAGHNIHRDQFQLYMKVVRAYLREVLRKELSTPG